MSYGAAGTAYSMPLHGIQRQIRGSPVSAGQAGARAYTAAMSRMLFLRDIQVDIQMRCRDCGHEGVLARPDLERRFGPNYPVLSIAPHYRCSRCHSKDVESSPGPPAAAPPDRHAHHGEDTVDAGIAALQGLLNAVRADRAPAGKDTVEEGAAEEDEDENDIVDLMPQLREAEVDGDADDDLFERTMASLRTVAHPDRDEDGVGGAEEARAPAPETVAAEDEDIPFDRSLAALRDLIEADEPEEDESEDDGAAAAEPAPPQPPPDPRAVIAELMEEEEEEEREPFFRPRESAPPSASEMELSLAALRALVEKAAEDGPEPEPEVDAPDAEAPEPDVEEPARAEPEPAVHASHARDDEPFDETIAALRSLIADRHRDADEDEDEPPPDEEEPAESEPESLDDITEDEILSFAIRDPELASPELASDDGGMDRVPEEAEHGEPAFPAMPFPAMHAEPPPVPPPARTSHLNETLAKLRGMLELDRPDKEAGHREAVRKDGDPAIRPRRR